MIGPSEKDIDAPYWTALSAGRLALPQCARCRHWHWPAVARCGDCGSWEHHWHDVAMAGTIFSWTRTWHPFSGTEGLEKPFVTVVVAIDGTEGRRLLGLLEGAPNDADIPMGARVAGRMTHTRYGEDDIPTITWHMIDRPSGKDRP